jgi:hypothetical protein
MMRKILLTTYYSPEEACMIYQFLDDFKETLWANYSEEIMQVMSPQEEDHADKLVHPDFFDDVHFNENPRFY